jgi:predicted  nucleic acid-binding Zn-ribbon protein
MDVREKLVEQAISHFWYGISHDIFSEPVTTYAKLAIEALKKYNGVTVQNCGRWEDDHGDYVCSCCHTAFTDEIVWIVRGESNEPNYCPHCGAKMMPQPPKGE